MSANFELRAGKALDARTVVATPPERDALPFAYAGLSVFVLSELRRYTLARLPASDPANWIAEGGGTTEATLPVTTDGQTAFDLPAGAVVQALQVNGQQQRKGRDWRQLTGSLEWISPDFPLETADTLTVLF